MWLGTWSGINKYDGNSFSAFVHDPVNPEISLRHNGINSISEGENNQIWIGTWAGLHLLDKNSKRITAFINHYSSDKLINLSVNAIYTILKDKDYLWFTSQGFFNKLDLKSYRFTTYRLPFNKEIDAYGLAKDRDNNFWVGTAQGLYKFNRLEGIFTAVTMAKSGPELNISSLLLDSDQILWIGTIGQGLFTLNTKTDRASPIPFKGEGKINDVINPKGIIEDSVKKSIYLATSEGLQKINKNLNSVTTYRSDSLDKNSLSHNNILSIFVDVMRNLWVGTDNGLSLTNFGLRKFDAFRPVPLAVNRIDENWISALFQDRNGHIWLRRPSNLMVVDSNFKSRITFPDNSVQHYGKYYNYVQAFHEDQYGKFWIGTKEGLHLMNEKANKSVFYRFMDLNEYSTISEDKMGDFWISSRWNGLIRFSPKTCTFTYFRHRDKSSQMVDNIRIAIATKSGDVWLGTSGGVGLCRLVNTTGKWTYYLYDENCRSHCLNDNDIRCIYEDDKGLIWIGTSQGGLNVFNPKSNQFTFFTTHDGLPSNHVMSIIEDKNGYLWLGTVNGLSKFNPVNKTFVNFSSADGLPDDEFVMQSAFKKNDRLFFGTKNGVLTFSPDSLKFNIVVPKVYITSLKVLGKDSPITKKLIELPYDKNYLSFDFVALNYNAPQKNTYAYKLSGIDNNWIYSGNKHFADYSRLSPGKYIFSVQGSNNDGVWNNIGDKLIIIIKPPWWRTTLAYIIYACMFITLIVFVDRLQKKRVIKKERSIFIEKEFQQAKEIEKAYHELKATQAQLIQSEKMASLGELTAGIAHEIQNPLNFVNNFSEVSVELANELNDDKFEGLTKGAQDQIRIITKDIKENLNKILFHGRRADSIVKSMLLHSRKSTGKKELTDINNLVDEYLRLSYQGFRSKEKGFNTNIEKNMDLSIEKVNIIPQDIGRVLLNLFNNSFYSLKEKASKAAPNFKPIILVQTRTVSNSIEIIIRDNGIGMDQAVIEKIFQPFFTTKPTGSGTGLGLSLSYDIITKSHGGKLKVRSVEGREAEFIITLPTDGSSLT
ncbi:MAG: sensor histidine kinase [Flavisolibacter sp.]